MTQVQVDVNLVLLSRSNSNNYHWGKSIDKIYFSNIIDRANHHQHHRHNSLLLNIDTSYFHG
jgi:hypothetical protein